MVEHQHFRDMITSTIKSMDVLDMHKSKAKTSIARIGTVTSILVFDNSVEGLVLGLFRIAKLNG